MANTSGPTNHTEVGVSRRDPTKLTEGELFWRDHQKWLQKRGYMLRPRYMPDWKASWLMDPKKDHFWCEDNQVPLVRQSCSSSFLRYIISLTGSNSLLHL